MTLEGKKLLGHKPKLRNVGKNILKVRGNHRGRHLAEVHGGPGTVLMAPAPTTRSILTTNRGVSPPFSAEKTGSVKSTDLPRSQGVNFGFWTF